METYFNYMRDLFTDILNDVMEKEREKEFYEYFNVSPRDIVEMRCFQAITDIKASLEVDSLSEQRCWEHIDFIIGKLEKYGVTARRKGHEGSNIFKRDERSRDADM